MNLVDADTRELISAWLVTLTATTPAVLRKYEVDAIVGKAVHKKIVFRNPWDAPRRFTVTSSDDSVMRHRFCENPAMIDYSLLIFDSIDQDSDAGGGGSRQHVFEAVVRRGEAWTRHEGGVPVSQ